MMFDSREAFIKAIEEIRKTELTGFKQWSDPIYPCPKCGGGKYENEYDWWKSTALVTTYTPK